ncbi:MAG: hypothetical protein D6830_03865 [Ignavibacteria bacterium]|nr:MAG: hypothetical protein D6830_03865 [Ignavibacteria bacterium]
MNEILFNGLVGQDRSLNILEKFYNSNRIPHALLFSGPEGVGKHLAAKNFIKLLNSNLQDETKKKIFSQIDQFEEPAIKFICALPRGKGETNSDSPVGKLTKSQIEEISKQIKKKALDPYYRISIPDANNIKINSIRDINKFISLYGNSDDYKAVIISQAHNMNTEAQNALLKNLEEPPSKIIFFLITDQPEKLLETIHSRSWTVNFNPLKDELVEKILEKHYGVEPREARYLALLANGSVSNALRLKDMDIESNIDRVIIILRYSLGRRYATALNEFRLAIEDNNAENFVFLMNLIINWFSDTVRHRSIGKVVYFEKHKETIEKYNLRFANPKNDKIIDSLNKLTNLKDNNISLNVLIMNIIFELAKLSI